MYTCIDESLYTYCGYRFVDPYMYNYVYQPLIVSQ